MLRRQIDAAVGGLFWAGKSRADVVYVEALWKLLCCACAPLWELGLYGQDGGRYRGPVFEASVVQG